MTTPETTLAQIGRRMLSAKAEQFTESVIREMTRLALKHNAVNLSQGFPDFPAPTEIKEAARQAISDDIGDKIFMAAPEEGWRAIDRVVWSHRHLNHPCRRERRLFRFKRARSPALRLTADSLQVSA